MPVVIIRPSCLELRKKCFNQTPTTPIRLPPYADSQSGSQATKAHTREATAQPVSKVHARIEVRSDLREDSGTRRMVFLPP